MAAEPLPAPRRAPAQKAVRRGTHRAVPPEVTWERTAPLLPRAGITRVADVTGLDDVGIPVFLAVRPAARTLSVSQGKGVTPALARVSAVMEAVELWHAEQPLPIAARGTARELALPYELDSLQLATPSLATGTAVLPWVAARNLTDGTATFLPAEYVQLSSVVERRWAPPLFKTTSNGLASGNTLDEALVHALCELIERDCVAELRRQPPAERRLLDLDSVDDPDARGLLALLAAAGNTVEVYDATNDLAVPCYEAQIWGPRLPLAFAGAGCHLDPGVALCRALTEAAQNRLTAISGSRDDLTERLYALQAVRELGRPAPLAGVPVSFARWERAAAGTLAEDLRLLVERVAGVRGSPVLAVELTRPGWPVAVVKAAVPGLRLDTRHELPRA